mmetsp:Transcript_60095/g.130335  ORF Transcript_60095/g.130335 Transcript_60095/m.130335 type:complete len:526 (-) Transcript_60095:108-1685(-)
MRRDAFLLGAALTIVVPDADASLGRIRVEGGRFLDADGRERFFRGVNVVYKDAPYLPHAEHFHANLSFVRDDAELLASMGVNLIRLGVMWPGVFPESRGHVEKAYLERARSIIRMAAEAGLYTIVEPHQDELNPRWCGEGVPDWWAREIEAGDFPVPVQSTPFQGEIPTRAQCLSHSSFSYIFTHDCARAFQALWERGAEDFGAYWAEVADFFRDEPSVVAGELFNEPFPGDVFAPGGRWRDNQEADRHNLQPFYENVTKMVRKRVRREEGFALAYEPTWPVADQDLKPDDLLTATSGFSALPEKNSIYAFHYYSPPADRNLSSYLDLRLADAHRLGGAPFASEFNLYARDAATSRQMAETFRAVESRLISFTGWQYKSYSGSLPEGTCTGCGNSFFENSGALNHWMASAMARPFVQAVAGHARTVDFDLDSRTLTLEYLCQSTSFGATEIIIPDEWFAGPHGWHLEVSGDDGATFTRTYHAGRTVARSVAISGWSHVKVQNSEAMARRGAEVRVSLGPVTQIIS